MQDSHSRNLIGVGKECGGLYCLEPLKERSISFTPTMKSSTWYRRLGHASNLKLQLVESLNF